MGSFCAIIQNVKAILSPAGLIFRDQRGVSAVEFSLIAPVLVIGGFATVDAGMAVYEEMMISQTLRSGAHLAIQAESEAQVLTVLEAVASENFTVASGAPSVGELSADVTSYCVCPEAMQTAVACTATCTGGGGPTQFYSLSATKQFLGVMLPAMTLSGSIDVIAQ
ncbi:MAG: TadE/TadG family type IV pilus assembly protein [Pseudomonadota bacterium]